MSMGPQGPGWWQASDGRWYPPESASPPATWPPSGAAWPPPTSRSGISTGAIVAIVLGSLVVLAALGAGLLVFTVGETTDRRAEAACRTERATLLTASAAARASNEIGSQETWRDFVKDPGALRYFTEVGTGFERTEKGRVPVSACRAITPADLEAGLGG